MTLEDFLNGVRYEIQGNVVIKIEKPDGYMNIYENSDGIFETQVDEYLNLIIDFIYAQIEDGKPTLVLELGEEDDY